MVHAVSAAYLRFEHMSPPAAGMALGLHLTVALALWWISPLKFTDVVDPQPIEVTMEAPTVPKPTPPATVEPPAAPPPPAVARQAPTPPPPATPKAAEPVPLGLPPPSSGGGAEKPAAAAPQAPEPQQALVSPKAEPTPQPEPAPEPPPVDKVLPKVDAPPPPLTMQDFVRIAPPPPPREIVKPLPQHVAPPPPAQQQLKPSPLGNAPNSSAAGGQGSGASASFINPADTYVRTRVADDYKWAVIRKFMPYLVNFNDRGQGGTVGLRIVISRDGRLVDASIARSSGAVTLDRGMLEAARAAAPYPPLPPEIPGDQFTFQENITAQR